MAEKAENKIELKSVSELLGMKFFIPSYQRGYRWTEQQVKDLLNDVWEFSRNKKKEKEFYCLQPLVVKRRDEDALKAIKNASTIKEVEDILKGSWEIIDGQQRLTTILILLSLLDEKSSYSLEYETRSDSKVFLSSINIDKSGDNIDYYHIYKANETISKWFGDNKISRYKFKEIILDDVKFIWYESVDEDPIKVFTRLNIGKISLTNAELIKALFLNRSNFQSEDIAYLKLRQQEIASEWDNIEYSLQNEEFWLFIHKIGYNRPTRIDFIFDLICENKILGTYDSIGTDNYKTFRYFYEYFRSNSANSISKIELCWAKVKKYFQIFQEWFNDLELYHYVGYLIYFEMKLEDLVHLWEQNDKRNFVSILKSKINDKIKSCNDLNKQYEIDGPAKTVCKPLLLLHNIQTIINQNNQLKSREEYKLAIFYKFPFHIFKKENWDVEHIDSNTTNGLEKEKDQKEWLKYSALDENVIKNEKLKEDIKSFLSGSNEYTFEDLSKKVESIFSKEKWEDRERDKNKIWNFVLLDAGTNRGYGNAIFPAKRRCIIGKDQGKAYSIDDKLEVSIKDGAIAFIPPVTKNVFLKYYNTSIDNLREWSENDAMAYKQNILETLKDFDVIDSYNNQNKGNND